MGMKKALVITAHPDDETIWMGGMILKNPLWDWTIFSLCRKDDISRDPKFKKVCKDYNAKSIISDLDDENLQPIDFKEIAKKIDEELTDKKYDYVFTHGKNGEYGHLRHKEIHKAVKNIVRQNKLKCKKLFFFSYSLSDKIPIASEKSDFKLLLDKKILIKKQKIIKNIYSFNKESFEYKSCGGKEAFIKLK